MRIHNIKPNQGAKHRRKRLGAGESSGLGKTSGRGHKGQKSRSGGGVRPGFEGGQMPLHRRLPKRGFNHSAFRDEVEVVNLDSLEQRFEDGDTVDEVSLKKSGLIRNRYDAVKVLGSGTLSKKLNIIVHQVSAAAKEKVEAAGGSVKLIEDSNN